jgi:hypothetical protein
VAVTASDIVLSHSDEPRLYSLLRQALNLTLPVVLLALGVLFLGSAFSTGAAPVERARIVLDYSDGPASVYYLVPRSGAAGLDAAQWMAGRSLDNIIVIEGAEHEGAVLRQLENKSATLLAFGHPGIEVVNLLNP